MIRVRGPSLDSPSPDFSRLMQHLTYRAEIDGLRALAVIPVVLFHLGLGFTGGYVGVDIFFVISGFLITSIILSDLNRGTFSLARFWERRIRRIVPAAAVTVLVTLILGLIMLPADFADLGRSAVAQALLVANFYFHATAGYFSAPAETKPLLHFWSLAVEEQFYLLFPLLLAGFGFARRQALKLIVGAVALGSFAISVVGAFRFPDAAFYLLHSRAWELAAGALLALHGGRLPLPDRWSPAIGWLGLALMIVPVFVYTSETVFPGLAALPPCAGAVLVIWATGRNDGLLKTLLSWRPVVFIGLISYSLYLWHWPVQVYAHYWLTGSSPVVVRIVVLGLCFGLAVLSWRFVELPFRARRWFTSRRAAVGGAIGVTAGIALMGTIVSSREGLPGRLPEQAVRYAAAYDDRPTAEEADVSTETLESGQLPPLVPGVTGPIRVLLWGDSHARVVSPAVEAVAAQYGLRGYRATRGATAGLLGWGDADSQEHNQTVLEWIERNRPDTVILASRWATVLQDKAAEQQLLVTVEALAATGVRIWIMRPVPFIGQDVPRALARKVLSGGEVDEVSITVEEHYAYTAFANAAIDRAVEQVPGVLALDPVPFLSVDGRCVAEIDGEALYYDRHHITIAGAERLKPMFKQAVRQWLAGDAQRRAGPADDGWTSRAAAAAPGPLAVWQP
jgi:peptidoglycan/LPS O-acetylase OafA/YrhL